MKPFPLQITTKPQLKVLKPTMFFSHTPLGPGKGSTSGAWEGVHLRNALAFVGPPLVFLLTHPKVSRCWNLYVIINSMILLVKRSFLRLVLRYTIFIQRICCWNYNEAHVAISLEQPLVACEKHLNEQLPCWLTTYWNCLTYHRKR